MRMSKQSRTIVALAMLLFMTALPGSLFSAQDSVKAKPGWMEWGERYYPARPVRGGYVRVASPVYIGLMNPHHFPVLDWVTMSNIYERLILLDAGYRPTVPWLAVSWEFLDDLTVVMRLRKGVVFHDGTPFNAQAVKYQMDWVMDRDNLAWTRAWLEPLQSVEVMDEYTLRWHFKKPWGAFLGTMASVPGYVVSPKALERDAARTKAKKLERELITLRRKVGQEKDQQKAASARKAISEKEKQLKSYADLCRDAGSLDTYPVGTGPFMFESASTDNYVQLKRNPSWWFGRSVGMPDMPYFDGVRVSVIPDPSVRLANLKAGKLDFIVLDAVQYRLVKDDPKFRVVTYPINWLIYLTFNHARGPCADIRVRKAISHAIDRNALVQGTQFGLGRVSSCVFPDDHWAHNPDLKPVTYDPELSKKLLAQAGYAKGLDLTGFTLNIPEAQAFAKAVMAMLEKVGIHWRPVFLSVTGMMEPFRKLDFDVIGNAYPWIQEPDHIATLLYDPDSPFNNGRSRNEEAIRLIKSGRETVNETQRARIYHKLEEALYRNYEDAWLWWPTVVLASSTNIQGFNADMFKKYGEGYYFSHPQWFRDGRP
ncbi:MAG TPA: ABC transporter substrate-binding protein [Deltaproteobacteria bacterium]|nr:ABC transporter substrate-binding protein [Deltaproteobacteria bacterium]HPP81607.1 ABC transporter substrate-binding protein [Deltaproteobacteria bacterium]